MRMMGCEIYGLQSATFMKPHIHNWGRELYMYVCVCVDVGSNYAHTRYDNMDC